MLCHVRCQTLKPQQLEFCTCRARVGDRNIAKKIANQNPLFSFLLETWNLEEIQKTPRKKNWNWKPQNVDNAHTSSKISLLGHSLRPIIQDKNNNITDAHFGDCLKKTRYWKGTYLKITDHPEELISKLIVIFFVYFQATGEQNHTHNI